MKIVITSFLPFGSSNTNSSFEVVKRVKANETIELKKVTLDVIYDPNIFIDIIDKEKPDILLLCGQAQGRKEVCIEQIGINLMHSSISDNLGVIKNYEKIYDNNIDGIFSTIPTSTLVNSLSNYPVKLSLSAGSFICNLSLYVSLLHCKFNNLKTLVGFIHYPLYTGQIKEEPNSLDLDIMVEITNNIIDLLAK